MIAAPAGCVCPCHTGHEPWPMCSCGGVHAPSDAYGAQCRPLWDTPWGCGHCHPDNPVPAFWEPSAPAPAPRDGLPAGARNHMRRYRQARARAERAAAIRAEAVESCGVHLRALLALGFSERKLATMVGLSRRRLEVLAGKNYGGGRA